jgi:glycine cleavage system regulatory protein
MKSEIILTLIAPDRSGLVGRISDIVAAHDGNWLESRMAHLAGSFAGILKLEVPSQQTHGMLAELEKIEGLSIHVAQGEIDLDDSPDDAEDAQTCQLEVIGQDRPGIVRQLSAALAERGVNVEELHTAIESAPMSGEPLFRAKAQLLLPVNCDLANLQTVLEAIGQDLMVDVQIN